MLLSVYILPSEVLGQDKKLKAEIKTNTANTATKWGIV